MIKAIKRFFQTNKKSYIHNNVIWLNTNGFINY